MNDPNPDHAALKRMHRKLEIMRGDAKTPALSADLAELHQLLTIIGRAQGYDIKTCTPI